MKTYFKATRPDGTDFHTGTVQYTVGESLPRIPKVAGVARRCCTSTVYHASDTPSETLIGGSWPCILFEVTGRVVASEGHKHGFVTLKVVREIPAWQALGPNGESVARLIEQAKTITATQAEELRAAWDAARGAARDAPWDAAWVAAWDAARDAARGAARGAPWDTPWDAAWVAARVAARDAAWVAARDAAVAFVVRDLITEEQFQLLAGPWISVVGEPA